MKPLAALRDAARLRGLLFDIDDTLTTEGRLTAQAYAALERLKAAGRLAVAVTGRPAGWCDHIARMWPVDAVVGENGAFYFRYEGGRLRKRYHDADDVRAQKRARLGAIAERILAAVPGSALASDQPYRDADLAIDYCEDVPPLGLEAADVDGAGSWQKFWRITLPSIKGVVAVVTLLSTIVTLNDFNIVWIMTRGGPGAATHIFATYSYELGIMSQRWGVAMAASMASLPLVALLIVGVVRYLHREEE